MERFIVSQLCFGFMAAIFTAVVQSHLSHRPRFQPQQAAVFFENAVWKFFECRLPSTHSKTDQVSD